MNKLWLIFAQTVTVLLAIFFVVSTLRPELLPWTPRGKIATIKEYIAVNPTIIPDSFNAAAETAMPSVVNIFTSKEVRSPTHPQLMIRRFSSFLETVSAPKRNEHPALVLVLLSALKVIF